MFKNYFKISLRNIWRDKEHSLISILGLATGVVASVLIFQYVNFETSYDSMHDQSDGKVYRFSRVSRDMESGEIDSRSSHHYGGISSTITEDMPEVKHATHIFPINGVFTLNDRGHNVDDVYATSSSFFDVFDFKLIQGNAKDLDEIGSVFLSQSLAKRIFGEQDPMGQLIQYNDRQSDIGLQVQVKGIFEDLPDNSHLNTRAFMSIEVIHRQMTEVWFPQISSNVISWRVVGFHTYFKTLPGIDEKLLSEKLVNYLLKYRAGFNEAQGRDQSVIPHTLEEIHFTGDFDGQLSATGNQKVIQLFKLIGILIVLIAWTNFINLASAKAVKRAKEIGVRKSLGAFKKQLVQQFLLEALIINFIALIVACGIILMVIPKFHQLTEVPAFDYFSDFTSFWLMYLGLFFLGSMLSGMYPALVLTKFNPINVLRGNFKSSSQGILLRKSLMLIQFAIVLIMLTGIISIRSQIKFMMNQDIGMNIDQTLVVDAPPAFLRDSTYGRIAEAFQGEIENNPLIKDVTKSTIIPGRRNQFFQTIYRSDRPSSESILLYRASMDADFTSFYDLNIIAGRGFNKDLQGDGNIMILNEEAVRQFDFQNAEEAVGKRLTLATGEQPLIVGVVEDFNNMGPKFAIDPMALELDTIGASPFINVRIEAQNASEAIRYLEGVYADFFPTAPFNSFFLDQTFNEVYENDKRFNSVLEFFAVVAIFISCLGIFGLSSFLINQKMKEISIRKVLGANILEILKVLTTEYLWLVLIATLAAIPAAYLLINNWLDTYLVRISIDPLYFVIPVVGLMVIIFLTVGNKTRKAAMTNPAKILKNE